MILKPILISLEGGDRCGKTTQITKLKEKLESEGIEVIALKHPDRSTASGQIIDKYLKKEIELSNKVITLCLTSNLWETSEKIDKYMSEGKVVIIDRYIHTNLAYSQIRGIEIKQLEAMMGGIRKPDIIFYLRTKTGNSEEISKRSDFGNERYETVDIQRQVSVNFDLLLLDKSKCSLEHSIVHEINSCKNVENVAEDIWECVKMYEFNKNNSQ